MIGNDLCLLYDGKDFLMILNYLHRISNICINYCDYIKVEYSIYIETGVSERYKDNIKRALLEEKNVFKNIKMNLLRIMEAIYILDK